MCLRNCRSCSDVCKVLALNKVPLFVLDETNGIGRSSHSFYSRLQKGPTSRKMPIMLTRDLRDDG